MDGDPLAHDDRTRKEPWTICSMSTGEHMEAVKAADAAPIVGGASWLLMHAAQINEVIQIVVGVLTTVSLCVAIWYHIWKAPRR